MQHLSLAQAVLTGVSFDVGDHDATSIHLLLLSGTAVAILAAQGQKPGSESTGHFWALTLHCA